MVTMRKVIYHFVFTLSLNSNKLINFDLGKSSVNMIGDFDNKKNHMPEILEESKNVEVEAKGI